ncbi:hypothetical protein M409DRAFT_24021 [Zasmidium cellare ATCC 36951]|uniref:Heterokaryon incompatibility domain-containing protein n=1 Tax=Zasmidium cellare ATCC 36951 TaxID=1080233 RepID=A0A6A6CGF9_ZASCE|nr:uncharacterized protein M409DRAFT_24021 [Zasmidium cellare ATCC 36951]KAF2165733.1 hypothetical protein M409DRAFT_24021 [Zasmidium cellare ATCC 36951]
MRTAVISPYPGIVDWTYDAAIVPTYQMLAYWMMRSIWLLILAVVNCTLAANANTSNQAEPEPLANASSTPRRSSQNMSMSLLEDETLANIAGEQRHERYEYTELQGPNRVRLFQLEPTEDEDRTISGSLVEADLADDVDYELLSYVASDAKDLVDITVNHMAHSITRDLHWALVRLRKANESRPLWIDVICLNQADAEEWSRQASMRKQIIESAESVLIWLGEAADNSHLVFEHVKKWTTYRDDYLAGRRTDNDAFGEAHINPPSYKGETWNALQHLAMRPWFFHAQVIKDLAFSRKAYLLCGDHIEDFKMIVKPMSFHIGNGYDPLNGVHGPTRLHLLDTIAEQQRRVSMKTLVQYISLCQDEDPRDKVFAMLDFFAESPISADYALSVEEVYTRFTRAVLADANHIQLLHWLGSHRSMESLPSWVPDYSIHRPGSILPRVNRFTYTVSETSELLRHVLPDLRFEGDKLIIRGVHVDTIKTVSEEMGADPNNAPGEPGFLDIFSKWESLATKLEDKRFSESISSAFLRTLIAFDNQHYGASDKYLSPAHTLWYEKFGTGLLSAFDKDAFEEAENILNSLGDKYEDFRKDSDIEHFTRHMSQTIYSRTLFITDSGSMGLAPPQARPGDSIVYYPGGLYPFVLRPRGGGEFEMVGDCYLYGFDEFAFSVEQVEGFGEVVVV